MVQFGPPIAIRPGRQTPRQPNFAQNMHPNKRCRRSLARPNRTTPEYHNVNHGVAVWLPWRFCVIAPIAFLGGMGGWCWRTWCVRGCVRSCGYFLLFRVLTSYARKGGQRPVKNKINTSAVAWGGRERTYGRYGMYRSYLN